MAGFVPWYSSAAARAASGSSTNLASMLLCIAEPARNPSGHSHASMMSPSTRLRVCRIGIGFTATSRFLVMKSQKILGQKKPWTPAAIWSMLTLVCGQSIWMLRGRRTDTRCEDDQASPVVLDKFPHYCLKISFLFCSSSSCPTVISSLPRRVRFPSPKNCLFSNPLKECLVLKNRTD